MKLHSNNNTITYFDSFGVEHFLKKVKKFINGIALKGFTITTNIFRIQACDSIICAYFYIEFIDFMLKNESLTGFTKDEVSRMYPDLSDQTFKLKINEIKDYSIVEIHERKLMNKRLRK